MFGKFRKYKPARAMLGNFRKYKPARKVRPVWTQARGSAKFRRWRNGSAWTGASRADHVRLLSTGGVGRRAASVSRRWACELTADRRGRVRTGLGGGHERRGRKCGKVRRAVGGWWTGNGAFAVSGRSWEVEFALPRRGRVRDDSGRRLGGAGGFGPNLSIVVSSIPARGVVVHKFWW